MTSRPPRISGAPDRAPDGSDDRSRTGCDWAVAAQPQPLTQQTPHETQPQHAYPAQQYHAMHRPAATAQRVRDRDAARHRVGGITAALAVGALVATGAAVIATNDSSATAASSQTSSSSGSASSSSSDSSSNSSSNSNSSNSGTSVASSGQSGVASSSGS